MQELANRLKILDGQTKRRYAPDAIVLGGIERRTSGDNYDWDGMRRGGELTRPFIVFQVTLSGQGTFEAGGIKHSLPAGTAFAAIVPSAHRYYLPTDIDEWHFFWVILRHPYVVARIIEQQRLRGGAGNGAILHLTEDSRLLACTIPLLIGDFKDHFDEELSLLTFLIEYERHFHTVERPALPAGEELREAVRQFVRERLSRPVDVSEIATAHGMSRSRFSHRFREWTGESPAQFMTQIRLEEAARRLAETDMSLTAIAIETGFADSNHLCKVFRRHYQLSPGTFRKQMR